MVRFDSVPIQYPLAIQYHFRVRVRRSLSILVVRSTELICCNVPVFRSPISISVLFIVLGDKAFSEVEAVGGRAEDGVEPLDQYDG